MGHGGHSKRKVSGKPTHGSKGGLDIQHPKQSQKKNKKTKVSSIKNKIRSVERLLSKHLPADAKSAQLKRLEELKKHAEEHNQAELEKKMAVRYHKVKFFERRKIDRGIKRLEKLQSADNLDEESARQIADELRQLKEDLEYVRFFPKTEKYISLFMGNEDEEVIAKRQELRQQIKANLAAMDAKCLEPEEMESEEEQPTVISDDDFFLAGSSSDDESMHTQRTKLEGRVFTAKTQTPPPFSRHGNKQPKTKRLPKLTPQSHDKRQSKGNNSKNKWTESNGQGKPTIHAHKRKWSEFDDQRRHTTGADDNSKKQKMHVLSPSLSSRPSSNHGKGLQVGNQLANRRIFKGASMAPSPGGAVINGPPPSMSSNVPTVMDMTNPDVKKKRKRKHRPKKKK